MYKRKKNRTKKIIACLNIIGITLLNLTPLFGVHTAKADIDDTVDWMMEVYEDNGSPSTKTRNPYSGYLNSTDSAGLISSTTNSQPTPSGSIAFTSSSNIAPGVAVTATATPGSFASADPSTLYFTWYIKRAGCDLGSTDADCDEDGDGKVTVNDWKIVAARRLIQGDYDNASATYSGAPGDDAGGGVEADPSVDDWVMTTDHSSGVTNGSGEDIRNCYVQEPNSGVIYELRETDPAFYDCPSGYHPACVHNTTANCNVLNPDPAYRSNPFGPLPKTVENTFSACAVNTEDVGGDYEKIASCIIPDEASLKNFEAYTICKDDTDLPICVSNTGFTNLYKTGSSTQILGTIFGSALIGTAGVNETNGVCSKLARENTYLWPYDPAPNFLENTCITSDPVTGLPTADFLPLATTGCSVTRGVFADIITGLPIAKSMSSCSAVVRGLINGLYLPDDTVVSNGQAELNGYFNGNSSTCTFDRGDNLCKHLFPYFPDDKGGALATGDGTFTVAEKEFWGANPASDETNGIDLDEAAVMGLGMDTITWTYAEGDQIGFAVEGETNIATDHESGGNRIMWAFSKGTCEALEDIGEIDPSTDNTRGFYGDTVTNKGILSTEVDLDDCLEENLVSPETDYNEIAVSLSSTPSSPMNDESGAGDRLTIIASVQNVNDLSSMYYDWGIGLSNATVPNDDTSWDWTIIDDLKKTSIAAADLEGLGKGSIELLLNQKASTVDADGDGVFWLRAKVTATENSGTGSQKGTAYLNIKIIQQQKSLVSYTVKADGSKGKLALDGVDPSCAAGSMCYVVNDQIIALKVSSGSSKPFDGDITWEVNNVSISCDGDISDACKGKTDTLFFPILGNKGEAVHITARGVVDGEVVEIIKKFVIIDPQTIIGSIDMDNAWPQLLGFFLDFDGNKYPDFSSVVYETYPLNEMQFRAATYSALPYERVYTWTIDGEPQVGSLDTITINVAKEIDDSYGLAVSAEMADESITAVNDIRRALLVNWGIVADDFIDAATEDEIQINVLDDLIGMNSGKTKTGVFASLLTNLPEQFMFLLKIVLTSVVLIFGTGLLFAVIPDSLFEKKKID